jgi:hypothetical protein
MKRSSEPRRFRPMLEALEGRDLPSAAGYLTAVVVQQFAAQAQATATARTSNLQTDFNTLQSNITNSGANASVTIASLGKAASDYGFAEQTYNLLSHNITQLETGIYGAAYLGVYDQSDSALVTYALNLLSNEQKAINSLTSTTATIGLTAFANDTNYDGNVNLAGVAGEGPIQPNTLG